MSEYRPNLIQNIFQQYADEINNFVRGRWPREQDVADIVQEAFLRLSQYPHLDTIQNHRAFLYRTATNVVIDRHRRRETRERFIVEDTDFETLPGTDATPEQLCESRESLAIFTRILEELPELHRHTFILFRIEACSHAEIAQRLGISVRCSERYVKQTMQQIAKKLADLKP
jgi:RNA polymerase sigma factor (sigma-70 family)